jgi:hypothetical protein
MPRRGGCASFCKAARVTDFINQDLAGSVFEDVYLTGARFHDVDLAGADFRLVDLTGASITLMAELARPAISMASAAWVPAGPSRPRVRSISATVASAALVQVASPISRSTPSACCADACAAASFPRPRSLTGD